MKILFVSPFPKKNITFEKMIFSSLTLKQLYSITPEGLKNAINRGIYNPPLSTREIKRVQLLAKNSKTSMETNWAFVVDEDGAEQWFPEPLG